MWKIPLFPIHWLSEFFLILRTREANFGDFFFISSLQTSLGLPVTSFLKKWAIYNKTITLNLEHTFFLRETFIYNYVSESFFFVERRQLNLIKTKNIPD